MDPRCYRGSYNPGYGIGFLPSYAGHHGFGQYPTYQDAPPDPTAALPTQLEYVWDIRNNSRQAPTSLPVMPFIDPMSPRGSEDDCSFASAQPAVGPYPAQPQHTWPSYSETSTQPPALDAGTPIEDRADLQAHNGLTPRKLMPQETYKTARKQRELGGSQVIEFYVYGERGVRLSDALGQNWAGFERRDDRSLFDDDRVQIMIRLHPVGCPSWQSKVYSTDHTSRRESITRAKLAYDVARSVKRFLAREKEKCHGDHSECSWKDLSLGKMYLTRLVRVSNASWQPEIFVGQPSTTTTPASLPPA